MKDELRNIIGKLPSFSAEERAQLSAALAATGSLGKSAKTAKTEDSDADLVLDALCSTVRKLGVENTSPNMLKKVPQYNAFRDKCATVRAFVMKSGCATRLEQQALLALGFELLYSERAVFGNAISSRVLMAQVHRIPSLIDAHFPGYARAGMLGWIVNRKENR